MYDLVAKRWRPWAYAVVAIECILAVLYLSMLLPTLTYWATIVAMGVALPGVIIAVTSKRAIQCACLGTVIQLPMTWVTIVENSTMMAMAVAMLLTLPGH
jgi:hypothetical protein